MSKGDQANQPNQAFDDQLIVLSHQAKNPSSGEHVGILIRAEIISR